MNAPNTSKNGNINLGMVSRWVPTYKKSGPTNKMWNKWTIKYLSNFMFIFYMYFILFLFL